MSGTSRRSSTIENKSKIVEKDARTVVLEYNNPIPYLPTASYSVCPAPGSKDQVINAADYKSNTRSNRRAGCCGSVYGVDEIASVRVAQ